MQRRASHASQVYLDYAVLTRMIVLYESDEIATPEILHELRQLVNSNATQLWCEQNNHCLDETLNCQLLQAIALSQEKDALSSWLSEFQTVEIQNDYTGTCGNENHIVIRLQ